MSNIQIIWGPKAILLPPPYKIIRAVGIGGGHGGRAPPPPPNNLHKYAVLLITKVCHFKKNYVCPPICKKIHVCPPPPPPPPPQSVIASYGPDYWGTWILYKRCFCTRPSRIDQVYQCDLLHVTAYVTARVPILLLYTPTLGKRSKLHHSFPVT